MLTQLFKAKKPFIGFITAGDGGIDYCVECCLQLIAGGVDILEIGLPFSDPVADGITIQQSSQRALQRGMNPLMVLEIAKRVRRESSVPLILFSYFNPLLQQGFEYLKLAKNSGFDALIVVDMAPIDNALFNQYEVLIERAGLQLIYLLTPSTSEERIQMITQKARGFLYYACQKGTTGIRTALPQDVDQRIQVIKKYTTLPVAVGFGIADRLQAEKLLNFADGFVVGSAFVKQMSDNVEPIKLRYLAQSIDPRGLLCKQ